MGDDVHMTQLINRLDGNGRSIWSNKQIKQALKAMPDGVRQRLTKNHRFIWNYSNENQNIDGISLCPADVKIIEKK